MCQRVPDEDVANRGNAGEMCPEQVEARRNQHLIDDAQPRGAALTRQSRSEILR
jgi:hypothetical protein